MPNSGQQVGPAGGAEDFVHRLGRPRGGQLPESVEDGHHAGPGGPGLVADRLRQGGQAGVRQQEPGAHPMLIKRKPKRNK